MTSLGERLKAIPAKTETVITAGQECVIRGIGRVAKCELVERCSNKKGGLKLSQFEAEILAACVIDPETNEPALPNPDDWDIPAEISGPLVDACMRLTGFSKDEIDAVKKSDATGS